MLGIDGSFKFVGNNRTPPTCTHDRDENVSWLDGVTFELFILPRSDKSIFSLAEFITHYIVYAQNSNAFVHKLTMQKLATKWSSTDRPLLLLCCFFHCCDYPFLTFRIAEHVEEGGLEEGVELGQSGAAPGAQGVRGIQNPRNALLLWQWGEGDFEGL